LIRRYELHIALGRQNEWNNCDKCDLIATDDPVVSLDGRTTLSYAVENNQAEVKTVLREVTK
jgi:hypothetical protein